MIFALEVFAGDRLIAHIEHDPQTDRWTLAYTQDELLKQKLAG